MTALPDLKVELAGLTLKNPVMTASGTFGYGEEFADYVNLAELGAIVVKGLSLNSKLGNPPPRIVETASGMLNTIGLQNIGVHVFVQEKLPRLRRFGVPIIANVYGETIEEYRAVSEILTNCRGCAALEINISCPNVKKGGISFGLEGESAAEVTAEVKKVTDLPVIVKLSPQARSITEVAKSVEAAGADAISLINTIPGMAVDIHTRKSRLSQVTGGLSGPAIKPIALKMVWDVIKTVSIPVIGVGGIMTAQDALEYLIVGARAIQVGTANFIDPRATVKIIEGISLYLRQKGARSVRDIIGTFEES
ncbi:MAG: dihydroorotate dehydrogenase [Syntrophales bacterium]|nr:dihydroorotate dehydrogenase [Syntrophales bacterium]